MGSWRKKTHAGAKDGFHVRLESGLHHALRCMTMGYPKALSKTVIQSIVKIKDNAADDRLAGLWLGSLSPLGLHRSFPGWHVGQG